MYILFADKAYLRGSAVLVMSNILFLFNLKIFRYYIREQYFRIFLYDHLTEI